MNPDHKRIVDLAAGWDGSEAVVGVSPADATLLESVGCPTTPGNRPSDPKTVTAPDLCAAARRLASGFHETPPGGQPTPNQQSVTGPRDEDDGDLPDPSTGFRDADDDVDRTDLVPAEPVNLDALTVAELKALADRDGIDITGHAKKADIVAAIRLARGE